jgi:membrane associated rhomboid family serine protease
MLKSIWDDIIREFSYGNAVNRLIIINVAIYVLINLLWVGMRISNDYATPESYFILRNWFSISSDWWHNLTHPWVFITCMFLHDEFWHIISNMLLFYWFGRIIGDFLGDQRVLALYLLGGLAGAIAFFVSVNFMGYGDLSGPRFALGASGAVMAVVLGAGVLAPDYQLRLLLLGDVKLKYIAGGLILIDVIAIGSNMNTGGHVAHLGGAFMGWVFISQLRKGNDLSEPVTRILSRIQQVFKSKPRGSMRSKSGKGPRVTYRNPTTEGVGRQQPPSTAAGGTASLSHQEQLDAILDKIKETGYESLSKEEKEFLFKASGDSAR